MPCAPAPPSDTLRNHKRKEESKMTKITYMDRLYMEKHQHRLTKKQLANDIGCSLSAVYYEFNRGGYWHTDENLIDHWRYSADIAQQDYDYKQTAKSRPPKLGNNWTFIHFIEDQIINHKASPYAALKRWSKTHAWTISINTLYRYIDSGLYFPNLTNKHLPEKKPKLKQSQTKPKPARPPKGTSIEKRPTEIASRTTWGHWEMDTVIGRAKGRNQACLVLTERLTRYEIIVKLKDKTTASVTRALNRLKRQGKAKFIKSLTVDNGSEFQDYASMKRIAPVYYCHPYTSCERGSNERMNRMIRRFFPKGSDFSKLKQKDCNQVQDWLNDYPRRSLGGKTPRERWAEVCPFPAP